MSRRPSLHILAQRHGILPSYIDQEGQRHETQDETYVALLAAMGVDGATERSARRQVEEEERLAAKELLAPVHVTSTAPAAIEINSAAVPGSRARGIEWELDVRLENGTRRRMSGHGPAPPLPSALPVGYHSVDVRAARAGAAAVAATQRLIVAPPRCVTPGDVIGARRVFGLLANLYTVRSRRNWGVGDCGDLRSLMRWSGEIGAAFVGINPLHALANTGDRISPYNPVSRLFRNVLYLDVNSLPELAETPAAIRTIASASVQRALRDLRAASRIDYARVLELKLRILRLLYRTFVRHHRDRETGRGRAYRRYCQDQGDALQHFATFEALREHWSERGRATDWHGWPASYRDRHSRAVQTFRRHHRDRIDFHIYLQFALDQQLADTAGVATARGVPIGMYQDLAIGSAGDGSDTWAFPELFVAGVSVGAPPDDYNAAGQNWSFPPLDPRRLRASGYHYYTRLLRASLRHAGALRIDHVMGLVRQYWIPAGAPAHQGAYVRVATDDLFGILALESHRARALIVGEDLGTVPPELPALLARWGVLSTRVLYFERNRRGAYRPANHYPKPALVSANTHDLPPVIGFLQGRDLDQRAALGLFADDDALSRAKFERQRDTRAMVRRVSGTRKTPATPAVTANRIHAFLSSTPAALLGIALDDLGAENEPVNVPGVSVERHPSWSRRMRLSLESLRADAAVARALRAVRARRWKKARGAR